MTFRDRLSLAVFWMVWPANFMLLRWSTRTRVLVVNGDEVVAVKGWIGDGKWTVPGGGLHKREQPAHGAVREMREETGLVVQPGQLHYLGKHLHSDRGLQFSYHAYVVFIKNQSLRAQVTEIAALAWVPLRSLTPHTASRDMLHCVALARAQDHLVQ